MAHHIYTTEAFVLESSMGREADRRFTLFTRELGMVRASAQGIRLIKSKLRFSLQDFSFITVSAVRGKEWWKIVNAASHFNLYSEYAHEKYFVHVFARIFRLLSRLIPEEGKHEKLFDEIVEAVDFIRNSKVEKELVMPFEYIVALRILNSLGYVGNIPEFQSLLNDSWSIELLSDAQTHSKKLIAVINTSIRESHL